LIDENVWDEETLDLICRMGQNTVEHLEDKDELKRFKYSLSNECSSVTSCVLDGLLVWMLRRMCN